MSIIPIQCLSSSDLRLLGNNVRSVLKPKPASTRPQYARLAAINRSLAVVGERVSSLQRPCASLPQ